MKSRIFDRFSESKKWRDYINLKTFECRIALIITTLILFLATSVDLYKNFNEYISAFQNATLYIAQALIGLIGIILAGVAIIISVFNKKLLITIEKLNTESNFINKILISFEFLAFNIGIGIGFFLIVHFSLYTKLELIPKAPFYVMLALATYFFFFIIFNLYHIFSK